MKALLALNTIVFGVVGSRYSEPEIGPLLAPTKETSCTVVVLNPYMVRSAGVNGLLKVTVKPVAVFWKPVGVTTKPWTVMGALKPTTGGDADVSLTMSVVPRA